MNHDQLENLAPPMVQPKPTTFSDNTPPARHDNQAAMGRDDGTEGGRRQDLELTFARLDDNLATRADIQRMEDTVRVALSQINKSMEKLRETLEKVAKSNQTKAWKRQKTGGEAQAEPVQEPPPRDIAEAISKRNVKATVTFLLRAYEDDAIRERLFLGGWLQSSRAAIAAAQLLEDFKITDASFLVSLKPELENGIKEREDTVRRAPCQAFFGLADRHRPVESVYNGSTMQQQLRKDRGEERLVTQAGSTPAGTREQGGYILLDPSKLLYREGGAVAGADYTPAFVDLAKDLAPSFWGLPGHERGKLDKAMDQAGIRKGTLPMTETTIAMVDWLVNFAEATLQEVDKNGTKTYQQSMTNKKTPRAAYGGLLSDAPAAVRYRTLLADAMVYAQTRRSGSSPALLSDKEFKNVWRLMQSA